MNMKPTKSLMVKVTALVMLAFFLTKCGGDDYERWYYIMRYLDQQAAIVSGNVVKVGSDGVILSVGDESSDIHGTSIIIQPDAVKGKDEITVEIIYEPDLSLPDDPQAKVILFKPVDYDFDKAVELAMPYGYRDNPVVEDLVIVRFDPENEEVEPLVTSEISEDTEMVYVEVFNLGYFAVTELSIELEEFTDPRDDNSYKMVEIGSQTWMAENLKYNIDNSVVYENISSNEPVYGRLYTYEQAKQACPDGWHLPSDDEWQALEKLLGLPDEEKELEFGRGANVGGKLKERGTALWQSPNDGATNTTRFSALPGGFLQGGSFMEKGQGAYFWTSTESGSDAWTRSLYYADSYIARWLNDKYLAMSVRCIKN